jgi:3-oxoacyl-[acyl-carrier-protein] synthase III
MKPFVINRHGRMVFPSNFSPELDFAVFESLPQFEAIIRRDFTEKAVPEAALLDRLENGAYRTRYQLLRDLAQHLFWVERYALTMYERRPLRWRDVPRRRDDLFLQVYPPTAPPDLTAALERRYWALPAAWDAEVEDECFERLLSVVRNVLGAGADVRALNPTVAEVLAAPDSLVYLLRHYDPDYQRYDGQAVLDCAHPVAELEALQRQSLVLHNQYPWNPKRSARVEAGALRDDDVVVALVPRGPEVLRFLRRAVRGAAPRTRPVPAESRRPAAPYPPVEVRGRFRVLPRLEALAVAKGEHLCTNDDLIRNHAYCCSAMTADEIREKTGIEQRCYTELPLEELSLLAARQALARAGRGPEEIGALLFCSCTSTTLIPSVATWLSGQLGIFQTHASCDITAACAGTMYGLAEAVRILQEVERPVLVVCGEKFSDKIGTVRPSRMIFADGAAALVVGAAPAGAPPDVEVLQTYASGPWTEVDSIIWPNPDFDNSITVYGPEVKNLVKRYLAQMVAELKALPHPEGGPGSLLDAIQLVVPHQANKSMVTALAQAAGLDPALLYFDIAKVGNTSAASIPIAIHDAIREGRLARRMRVFAPGFGAGAVAGYAVLQVDPAIAA